MRLLLCLRESSRATADFFSYIADKADNSDRINRSVLGDDDRARIAAIERFYLDELNFVSDDEKTVRLE